MLPNWLFFLAEFKRLVIRPNRGVRHIMVLCLEVHVPGYGFISKNFFTKRFWAMIFGCSVMSRSLIRVHEWEISISSGSLKWSSWKKGTGLGCLYGPIHIAKELFTTISIYGRSTKWNYMYIDVSCYIALWHSHDELNALIINQRQHC